MKQMLLFLLVACSSNYLVGANLPAFNKAVDDAAASSGNVAQIVSLFTYRIQGQNDRQKALGYLLTNLDIQALPVADQAALKALLSPPSIPPRFLQGISISARNQNWLNGGMPVRAAAPSNALVPSTPAAPAQPSALVPASPAVSGSAAANQKQKQEKEEKGRTHEPKKPAKKPAPAPVFALPAPEPEPEVPAAPPLPAEEPEVASDVPDAPPLPADEAPAPKKEDERKKKEQKEKGQKNKERDEKHSKQKDNRPKTPSASDLQKERERLKHVDAPTKKPAGSEGLAKVIEERRKKMGYDESGESADTSSQSGDDWGTD